MPCIVKYAYGVCLGQFTTGWDLHWVQTALIDNTVTGITIEELERSDGEPSHYALATRTLWLERAARPEATATSEDLERWDAELARAVEALDVTPEARPMWLWCAERYY